MAGCSEFSLLSSGTGFAVTQNSYAKVYNGLDVLTYMNTKKDIKSLVYENIKNKKNDF